ncbi:hypothetical protein DOTSEDRAFT_72725 [Dothistroma septosporum NZE10]|uniref:Uncharacterized protein n=1 Tax=Dothistroma septosporum (strain NZE10 / CBS 128990) TaxID=675120 RepID=M2Y5B1_DOTSN|nr:hypothetical protein DOTSEDRAFT_72725 [Dothistroma septosporum NZE10]
MAVVLHQARSFGNDFDDMEKAHAETDGNGFHDMGRLAAASSTKFDGSLQSILRDPFFTRIWAMQEDLVAK